MSAETTAETNPVAIIQRQHDWLVAKHDAAQRMGLEDRARRYWQRIVALDDAMTAIAKTSDGARDHAGADDAVGAGLQLVQQQYGSVGIQAIASFLHALGSEAVIYWSDESWTPADMIMQRAWEMGQQAMTGQTIPPSDVLADLDRMVDEAAPVDGTGPQRSEVAAVALLAGEEIRRLRAGLTEIATGRDAAGLKSDFPREIAAEVLKDAH